MKTRDALRLRYRKHGQKWVLDFLRTLKRLEQERR